jgi:dephospho-CoA kinase
LYVESILCFVRDETPASTFNVQRLTFNVLNVALTGNIAAGKSVVADLFRRWGATVIDADDIVREVQAPGGDVLRAIQARFGASVIRADGSLDRPALRRRVMADPQELAALNRIVHPAVHARRTELVAAARARGDRLVVNDIPLLFEAADPGEFDAVVLVDAPEDLRLARLIEHRGLTAAEGRRMIEAQLPARDKRARSHFIIDNDGDLASLEHAAAEVWRALLSRA